MMMISEQNTFLYSTKNCGRELNWGETERERGRETEFCCEWVTAWAINLTVVQIFIAVRERIILGKMNIKIFYKKFDGYYFSRCCAFSSNCQTTNIHHSIKCNLFWTTTLFLHTFSGRHDTQQMTLSIMTLSIYGLFARLNINDTQHNETS